MLIYLSLEVRALYPRTGAEPPGRSATPSNTPTRRCGSPSAWCCCSSGIALRSQPARLASAAVVLLTVAKVFLLDMAGLDGIFRALSFIGLGLVLVGIGWLYQRLLFPPQPKTTTAPVRPGAARKLKRHETANYFGLMSHQSGPVLSR